MKLPHRRQFLHLAAGAAALPAVSRIARAQTYPSRPVHIIVGFAAGGGPDIVARLIGQWLADRIGQPCIIDNRPGAGTNIAMQAVVKAPPDGYTLGMIGTSSAISMTLSEKPNYDYVRDIAPVASIARGPFVMLVAPSFPAKSVPEFIAFAKANPGKINMASAGTGTASHVAGELFKTMTGVNLQHVPYRGAVPAATDLLSGQAQVLFNALPPSVEFVKTGRLVALAVTTAMRSEALPEIPTVGEFVPGYEASIWIGIGAPKGTPAEIVNEVNKEINAALANPEAKARLADLGNVPAPMASADVGKLMAEETEKWRKVIRAANIKAE
jgi:tripartite-type tricarboxylate transporter receptor subunit TctC